MKHVLVSGLATVDMIFYMDELPAFEKKYRAKKALITTGGNAANASIAISRLGGKASLLTQVGQDFFGNLIMTELAAEKVETNRIDQKENISTAYSSIIIDKKGARQIINYRTDNLDFSNLSLGNQINYEAYLTDGRSKEITLATLREARKKNKPGILDAEEPVCHSAVKLASHVAFSRQGLSNFCNTSSILKGLKIVEHHSNNWICVTDGERGVFFLDSGKLVQLKPPKTKVVDTLGAGDVWHGAFSLALSYDKSMIEAIKFANIIASKKCQKYGSKSGAPYKDELSTDEYTLGMGPKTT